jgi:hypothetical protein
MYPRSVECDRSRSFLQQNFFVALQTSLERIQQAIHDPRAQPHGCGWRPQPIAFRLRFFQAATSRLRRRANAANTSPVKRT